MAHLAKLVAGTMLVLLCQLTTVANANLMDTWKKLKSYDTASADNTRAQLALASQLSDKQQRELLHQIGKRLEATSDMDCNIFGGTSSCKALPEDSKFAEFCPNHPLTVDCAYYNEALVDIEADPVAALKAEMEKRGDEPCEQCLQDQRELWCAQAVPPCGSFQKHVELAILPAVTDLVVTAPNVGATPLDQIQKVAAAVPKVVKAISLSMPCREMCEDVIKTCNCGKSHTYGYLVTQLREQQAVDMDANLAMLPPEMADSMYSDIWDMEICDLYTPVADPDFSGHCNHKPLDRKLPQESCRWCGDEDMGKFAEFQLADMLAKEMFSWITGPVGIFAEAHELTDETHKGVLIDEEERVFDNDYKGMNDEDEDHWEYDEDEDDDTHDHKGGGGKGVLVTVLVLMMVSAAGFGGGYYYYKNYYFQARHRGGQDNAWAVETGTDYIPMDYEAPVVPSDSNVL